MTKLLKDIFETPLIDGFSEEPFYFVQSYSKGLIGVTNLQLSHSIALTASGQVNVKYYSINNGLIVLPENTPVVEEG